jgi:hypothetical protein
MGVLAIADIPHSERSSPALALHHFINHPIGRGLLYTIPSIVIRRVEFFWPFHQDLFVAMRGGASQYVIFPPALAVMRPNINVRTRRLRFIKLDLLFSLGAASDLGIISHLSRSGATCPP